MTPIDEVLATHTLCGAVGGGASSVVLQNRVLAAELPKLLSTSSSTQKSLSAGRSAT